MRVSLTLHTHYNRILPLTSDKLKLAPITPICSARYYCSRVTSMMIEGIEVFSKAAQASNLP